MQELKALATFETVIGGIVFVQRRRSTATMLEVGNVRKVLGLIQGANVPEDKKPEVTEKAAVDYADMVKRSCFLNLVSINGVLVDETEHTVDNLAHVSDALFKAFLNSGLDVDPMPGS